VQDGRLLGFDVAALAARARELGRDLAGRAGLASESLYAGGHEAVGL
jgi:hypothetical protein